MQDSLKLALTASKALDYDIGSLSLEEAQMSIVMAMSFEDYFLIGGDSKVNEPIDTSFASKLGHLNDLPLAWGYTGNLGVGREFSHWMLNYTWNKAIDWYDFQNDAASKLIQLNNLAMKFAEEAGDPMEKRIEQAY